MRKGLKWFIGLLFVVLAGMVLIPIVAGWFVMM